MAAGKNPALEDGQYDVPSLCIDLMFLLENAQQYSHNHQTGKVPDKAGTSHDDSPARDEDSQIVRRTLELLKKNVARNFTEDVRNED